METGLIIKSTGSWYLVKQDDRTVECKIKGKFRIKGIKTTNPLAVGDWVDFQYLSEDKKTGLINKIHPRKNYIIRKSINLSKRAHIIAANIDQAFLIVTLAFPQTSTGFIDRFLVTAEAYRIPANIVFNKIDLYDEKMLEKMNELKSIYEKIGYTCYETSATKDIGIENIRQLMKDKINLTAGHSGVGKSTLINALDSNLNIKTTEISEYHNSGKHTTTFAEMHPVASGGMIIDTPGIKGLGMVDMKKEEMYHFFPELFKLAKNCRFHNCTHTHEPDCAIKAAVVKEEIAYSRYMSYRSIFEGDDDKYREDIYK